MLRGHEEDGNEVCVGRGWKGLATGVFVEKSGSRESIEAEADAEGSREWCVCVRAMPR